MNNIKINFCAGPAEIPLKVLTKAQQSLISFNESGVSILSMSHRSADFTKIITDANVKFRQLLNIPDNYKVLFLQGGATAQFSSIPLNLINRGKKMSADYIVTGLWSSLACKEAAKYGSVREVFPRLLSYVEIPPSDRWNLDPEASYIYYCANETAHGVEFHSTFDNVGDVPIVCDMSSNILTREFPISKFGLVFASAQKNLGCAGVTIVIVRDDLLQYAMPLTPVASNYNVQSSSNSLYNTPPTFPIYITGLMLNWMAEEGGLKEIGVLNDMKSTALYNYLDSSNNFYKCPVKVDFRSRVNVVFRIKNGDEDLEDKLIRFAKEKFNIIEIKGHRSVGGLRVSLYNAITIDSVNVLIKCLKEFSQQCDTQI